MSGFTCPCRELPALARELLGTSYSVQEASIGGQQGRVGIIGYGWIWAIEIFMEH